MWNPLHGPQISVWPTSTLDGVLRFAERWEIWDGSAWVPTAGRVDWTDPDLDPGDLRELSLDELRRRGISDPRVAGP